MTEYVREKWEEKKTHTPSPKKNKQTGQLISLEWSLNFYPLHPSFQTDLYLAPPTTYAQDQGKRKKPKSRRDSMRNNNLCTGKIERGNNINNNTNQKMYLKKKPKHQTLSSHSHPHTQHHLTVPVQDGQQFMFLVLSTTRRVNTT